MASRKLCSVDGCVNVASARGWCEKHYMRARRHGDPFKLDRAPNGSFLRWLEEHQAFEGSECLIWPFKTKTLSGYAGTLEFEGSRSHAHRVMCILVHGQPSSPGLEAAHNCGMGHMGCVNPRHLRWASPQENTADKFAHGTVLRGEGLPTTKLTEDQVREIRKRRQRGETLSRLADEFGVSFQLVSMIARGKCWGWLA